MDGSYYKVLLYIYILWSDFWCMCAYVFVYICNRLTEIQNCEATAASTSPRRLRTQPEHVSTALRLIQNCTTSSKTLQEKENLVSGPVINLTEVSWSHLSRYR